HMPVAVLTLDVGVRETMEVMKVFDKSLATFLEITNPEEVLNKVLPDLEEEEDETTPSRESFAMPDEWSQYEEK
ncbi:unnamed protein product, partial [marine sediment metagenome]